MLMQSAVTIVNLSCLVFFFVAILDEFSRLVCETVPEKTLQAWLTCNRSCFTLVQ